MNSRKRNAALVRVERWIARLAVRAAHGVVRRRLLVAGLAFKRHGNSGGTGSGTLEIARHERERDLREQDRREPDQRRAQASR
jgi:hypothetical protein